MGVKTNLVDMNTFKVKIEEITFDLEDESDPIPYEEEVNLQAMLQEVYINKTYEISAETEEDAHDEVMDIVSNDTGWCIYSLTSVIL
jgi:hypothetical protein